MESDHSGEILFSGVKIISKTREFKTYGKDHAHFPVYLQKCGLCGKEFKAVYNAKRKSCPACRGCIPIGTQNQWGTTVIERIYERHGNTKSWKYRQKCGLCGKEFVAPFSNKYNACKCNQGETDRSGMVTKYGIEIIRKTGERKNSGIRIQNRFIYEMKCPKCGCLFSHYYNDSLKSCGCMKEERCNSNEQKEMLDSARKKNNRFGTNIGLIKSDRLPANNTSGYKGVSYNRKKGYYQASICFQGVRHKKVNLTFEEAISTRREMERVRDSFITWYDSLSQEEKDTASLQYENKKEFFMDLYKEQMKNFMQR